MSSSIEVPGVKGSAVMSWQYPDDNVTYAVVAEVADPNHVITSPVRLMVGNEIASTRILTAQNIGVKPITATLW